MVPSSIGFNKVMTISSTWRTVQPILGYSEKGLSLVKFLLSSALRLSHRFLRREQKTGKLKIKLN
jgi:hypothetical protein